MYDKQEPMRLCLMVLVKSPARDFLCPGGTLKRNEVRFRSRTIRGIIVLSREIL